LGAVSESGDSVALCSVEEEDEVVKDGAEKKKQSRVLVDGSEAGDNMVIKLNPRCALAMSGWQADRRFLVGKVKSAIAAHHSRTGAQPPIEEVCNIITDLLHGLSRNKMLRPLVVSCLLAGVDQKGLAKLFKIGTDGSVESCLAASSAYSSNLSLGLGLALGKGLSNDEQSAVEAMRKCLQGLADEEGVAEVLRGTKSLRLSSLLVLKPH